jgi:hypothetical protein
MMCEYHDLGLQLTSLRPVFEDILEL